MHRRRHPNQFLGDVQRKELAPQGDTQLLYFAADGLRCTAVEPAELRLAAGDHHGQFGVAFAKLAAVIDVGAAKNGHSVISDQQLAVYINLFGHRATVEIFPGSKIKES